MIFAVLTFINLAFAGGVVSIHGSLVKCIQDECRFKIDSQLYIINVKRLNLDQQKKIKLLKIGDSFSDSITFSAIKEIKDISSVHNN